MVQLSPAHNARVGATNPKVKLKPTVLLRHEGGVTAQWWDPSSNYLIVALYTPLPRGKYALNQVAGPWSGVSKPNDKDPSTWLPTIEPGYESERAFALDRAELLLTCLNADYGGLAALKTVFQGPMIGFSKEAA